MAFAIHSISLLLVVPTTGVVSGIVYPFYTTIQTSSPRDYRNNFICMLQKAYFVPSNSGSPSLEYSPYLSMILSEIYLLVVKLYLKELALIPVVRNLKSTKRGRESVLDNFSLNYFNQLLHI